MIRLCSFLAGLLVLFLFFLDLEPPVLLLSAGFWKAGKVGGGLSLVEGGGLSLVEQHPPIFSPSNSCSDAHLTTAGTERRKRGRIVKWERQQQRSRPVSYQSFENPSTSAGDYALYMLREANKIQDRTSSRPDASRPPHFPAFVGLTLQLD